MFHIGLCFLSLDRFDCGSGSGVVKSSSPVKLEQWNKASIVRRRWDGWMQLNDGPFTQGRSKVRGVLKNHGILDHRFDVHFAVFSVIN